MQLLGITNWRQLRDGDCLPACAAMAFTHLGLLVDFERLRQQLAITRIGAPFSNLARLKAWGVVVEVGHGNLATLQDRLSTGHPVIVAVATELLPYWMTRSDIAEANRETEHAVVVVGLENETVYINDPDFDVAPQSVEVDWFVAAWQHQRFRYAVIRK